MSVFSDKRKARLGTATQVFIGLGLGVVVGVLFGEEVAFLKIAGDAYIGLLQITVIPYIVIALITSLGRLTFEDVKILCRNAGSVLLLLWGIGVLVVFSAPLAFPDWPSSSFFSASQIEEAKPVDFLSLYIPSNIFFSLSYAIVPAIVVFSVLFGLALIKAPGKEPIIDILSTIGDVLMGITGFVGKIAPYGVFAIVASAAGTISIADLGRLQVYIVIYVVLALILSLWLIPGLIAAVTPLRYGPVMRTFRGPLITAFATGSLLIVLPLLVADSKKLLARKGAYFSEPTEQEGICVTLLIPTAYPFPTLGTVLALLFVLFGGWYIGSAVSIAEYPTLVVAGLASLFGGAVLALPFLFDLLRLPSDLFHVFLTVDVIASRFGTLLAAMHILAIALIGTYAMQGAIVLRPMRLFRFAAISGALIAAALIGIRALYTYVYVQPYELDRTLAGLELIADPQPHTVYREAPREILAETGEAPSFARMKERGVLRACYMPDDYPSAFFNTRGELVGFDVELTHRFARHLDLPVDFLPVFSVAEAAERINSSYCDILAALIPITPRRTDNYGMTSPVFTAPVGLIVADYRRNEFREWVSIRAASGLRIGVYEVPEARSALARILPNATPVPFSTNAELDKLLAAGAPGLDAIVYEAEAAAAWAIRYPRFTLVTPKPTLFVPLGFAVAKGDTNLLEYLDTWLLNAKADGTVDALYRYWMLGEIEDTQPPRWSVIRNVLGWID